LRHTRIAAVGADVADAPGRSEPMRIDRAGLTFGTGAFVVALALVSSVSCGRSKHDNFAGDGDGGAPGIDFSEAGSVYACQQASQTKSSVGCEYYAIHMDGTFSSNNGCFVSFISNTFDAPVHIDVAFDGRPLDVSTFVKIPRGGGRNIKYDDFDAHAGLAPGDVAILFLAGLPDPGVPKPEDISSPVPCPVAPALSSLTQIHGTGIGRAFRIRTDFPVVAYQMLPFGGGGAAVTGATLLLPTTAYGTNYVAVDAYTAGTRQGTDATSMNLVAAEDDTTITIRPKVDIVPGSIVPGASAGDTATYKLDAGQVLQITQTFELTGSPINSDKPIGLFAGQPCLDVIGPYCDHAEQQIPSINALGNEYVAATYRQRDVMPENPPWRIIGAVDGTELEFSSSVGGPSTVNLGDVAEFRTGTPFTVKSQDADHPFLLVGYMTGAQTINSSNGDADFVRAVPVPQYMDRYVFFTDPTYPETNLVVTRKRSDTGFADVSLDCAGILSGWSPIGDGTYEMTRIDLVRHDFQRQGNCDNGRHEMTSLQPFGLTIWGWGTSETTEFTGYVSYGYPAGQNLKTLTNIVVR
jgi:hypothetical protein